MEPTTLCPACLGLLRDPVLLKCGHNMCRECAKTLGDAVLGATKLNEYSLKKTEPVSTVVCPMCGTSTPFSEVVDNTALKNFLDTIRPTLETAATTGASAAAATAEPAVPSTCGFCKQPPTKFCRMCGALCEEHSAMLHVQGPFKDHVLSSSFVPVFKSVDEAKNAANAAISSGIPSAEIATPLCPEHHRPLKLYCIQCDKIICSHCAAYGKHSDHKTEYMSHAFAFSDEKMKALYAKVEQTLKQVEEVAPSFSPVSSDGEKEKSLAQLHEIYGSLKEYIRASEKNACDEVDAIFHQFDDEVRQRIISCHEIEREAQSVLASADRVAVVSDLTKYLLFQSLLNLNKQLKRLSSMKVPELKSIVKIEPEQGVQNKMRVCTLRSHLQSGDRALVFFELNKEHIIDTFSVSSDVQYGQTSSDGGSVYIPEKNLIISNSAEMHHGRSLSFITFRGTKSLTKDVKHDAVGFRCGGMYPAFDGHDHVYFFQQGEGANDKFGRLDVNTQAFEMLASLPAGSFLSHTSAAANPQHVYAMDNKMGIWDYCVDLDTWTDTHIRLAQPARLFFDPIDLDTIIAFCGEDEGIYTIDIEAGTKERITVPPKPFSLRGGNRDAFFARSSADQFFMFAFLADGWYLFDSHDKSWAKFENWDNSAKDSASFFIEPHTRIAFYIGPNSSVFHMVELSGVTV